ncbi:Aste57867_23529 [Aphanomyces stellatus]|uniref:Aste57867_23529 protein n=1 Tax=Aphanomyces stellatus TaxID=120398 RepID=A0A485LNR8_9STRA|nr:hypothetical protein As57867_023458 [Aphanomyces stellatus]VFU00174.1 Aste57867_23529 [Aphanomyces stellatus]
MAETTSSSTESIPLVIKVTSAIDVQTPPPSPRHRLLGLGLVAMSAFTFSLLSAAIKCDDMYESSYMSSMETVFWRSFVALVFIFILILVTRTSLHVPHDMVPFVIYRSVGGFCVMALTFWTMSQMVLADASCIIFTAPVMTFLLGALVLGEHIKPVDFALAISCFGGVVFVARPAFLFGDTESPITVTHGSKYAILGGLAAAAFQSSTYVVIRRLKSFNFLVVIFYFMLVTSVLSATWIVALEGVRLSSMSGFQSGSLSTNVRWTCVGTGFLGFIGQLCMTKGFQLENAGIASVMRYLDIVFVFVWDTTLLHEHINPWSFVGAAIIFSSAIAIAIRKANHA